MMTQNEFEEKIEFYLESLIEIKKQCDEKRLNCPKTIKRNTCRIKIWKHSRNFL